MAHTMPVPGMVPLEDPEGVGEYWQNKSGEAVFAVAVWGTGPLLPLVH
jgi:hypothetical protein